MQMAAFEQGTMGQRRLLKGVHFSTVGSDRCSLWGGGGGGLHFFHRAQVTFCPPFSAAIPGGALLHSGKQGTALSQFEEFVPTSFVCVGEL